MTSGYRLQASGFRLQATLLRVFHFFDASINANVANNEARSLKPTKRVPHSKIQCD